MSDLPFVGPGDIPPNSAATYNAWTDAARLNRQRQYGTPQVTSPQFTQTDTVLIQNSSSGKRGRYALYGLNEPVFLPSVNQAADITFREETCFTTIWPATTSEKGRFVVAQSPLIAGGIGTAIVAGIAIADVLDTVEKGDVVDVGSSGRPNDDILSKVEGGSAVVLWTGPGQRYLVETMFDGSASQNEQQQISLRKPDGGTFKITFDGQQTTSLVYNASNGDVKAALEALSNIDLVDVTGGPLPGVGIVVEFQGSLANTDLPQMTIQETLTGIPNLALIRFSGGGSGGGLYRFRLTSVDCDTRTGEAVIQSIPCDSSEFSIGDAITVHDKAGCFFDVNAIFFSNAQGYATYNDDGDAYEGCEWEVVSLCATITGCNPTS